MTDQSDLTVTPALLRNRRLVVAVLMAVGIAATFWLLSRVPALNEKAQMGLRTNVSAIAFNILLPVADDQPVIERVARSTVNWLYTNWKGMTFGLLFAAAALTILGSIKQRSFGAPWLNTVSGMFLGAPLGVCVNCATPIAQGMAAAGARLETSLAMLVSSPMLNPIVLSMMITLLPWEMALGNVLAVVILLSSLPLLVRRFGPTDPGAPADSGELRRISSANQPPAAMYFAAAEDYLASIRAIGSSYSRNLLYITRLAVPLMLLAGALGALAIELTPFDQLSQYSPGLIVLLTTALIAAFLPVPIAFNVIVVLALQSKGMHPGIGAVLLFALSVFSIYPATIIAKYISARLSLAISITVVLIATALGLITAEYFDQKFAGNQRTITQGITENHRAVFGNAMSVCNDLPDALQLRCFSEHIEVASGFVEVAELCESRPGAIDLQSCQQIVDLHVARELALDTQSSDACRELVTNSARVQCNRYFVVRSAIRNHDIAYCEQLNDDRFLQGCRNQYLNASLLFNPDDSVCSGLRESELSICKVNAQIYRTADTLDFKGCTNVPMEAQEHCRWITATNLVGRSNDASGCTELESPSLRARCNEHVVAWRATRTASFELCRELSTDELRNTCLLRVASRKIDVILTNYSLNLPISSAPNSATVRTTRRASADLDLTAPVLRWQTSYDNAEITVSHVDYRAGGGAATPATLFTRVSGSELGIEKTWDFRVTDFFEPFIIGKGIASGDFNNDGWPDLVLASERGALFYSNTGGRFQLIDVAQGDLQFENLFLVALIDADGDGSLDLFASTYGNGNYLLLNRNNNFEETELTRLNGDQRLTMSAGFADIDQDGDLDIVLGNWSSGVEKLFSSDSSANSILYREKDSYRSVQLNDINGETNSVLVTDIDGDARPDLLFGNDRPVPDVHYLSAGSNEFEPALRKESVFPVTSMFTMSLDSADFNNDLKMDLYSTDMTFARSSSTDYCEAIRDVDAKERCAGTLTAFEIFISGSAAQCSELTTPSNVRDCFLAFSIKAAKTLKDDQYCEQLPRQARYLQSLCYYISSPILGEQRINQDSYVPQAQRNVLLMNSGDRFVDKAEAFGVDSSFWSWNAKAADLDNDGWQDIYVGNGFHFGDSFYEVQSNVMFRNIGGKRFENIAQSWGLDDTINTPSYTYLDLDLDGDVDIVATGVLAPPRVYINQQKLNNSITFLLHQETGNSFSIGAAITILYGGSQNYQQHKEIKMSGGFMSFDSARVHFGISSHSTIDGFTVTWPDGQVTSHQETLKANRFYRIERK